MTKTTCQSTYEDMLTRRQNHPLPYGLYKLREARDGLNRIRSTVEEIKRHEVRRLKYNQQGSLGCCLTYERGQWLKSVPNQIAEILGYQIVPAIGALTGDGVPVADVERLMAYAHPRVNNLINACEAHRNRLRPTVKIEYQAMRHGGMCLKHLLADVEELVDTVLVAAAPTRLAP